MLADACLGVPGRPQSATGQTAIFTGRTLPPMSAAVLGFPNAPLRELLRARSLFRALAAAGRSAVFANAYPIAYLRALGLEAEGEPEPRSAAAGRAPRPRRSPMPRAGSGSGPGSTCAGRAVTHDLTGRRARALGVDLPERTPEEAAEVLRGLAAGADLAVVEFFETDEAGHARSMEAALDALCRVDAFLRALVAGLGPHDALVVASDHGNVEDLSRSATARSCRCSFGRAAPALDGVRDLTDLAPLLALAGAPAPLPR